MFHVERFLGMALLVCLPVWAGGAKVAVPHDGLQLAGRLYAPISKGRFPAIVLLHGCNGMWASDGEPNRNYEAWAKHFQQRGYVALLLDSFGPRGETEICTQGIRKIHPGRERAADAHAALRWLAARDDVARESIHLLGWSNGGTTALLAVSSAWTGARSPGPTFRSAVAFYPSCREWVDRRYATNAPVLIQAGGADDWTPAPYCQAMVTEAKERGERIEIDVYEGAHHAFDGLQGRVRYRPDVRNPSSPSGRGAHLGPDPAAREKSRLRATEFVEAHR
jgi:dienelactone hydrolase